MKAKMFFIYLPILIFPFFGNVLFAETGSDAHNLFINLTQKEEIWLNAHRSMRVSGPGSFPPFHFINEENEVEGIAFDYMKIIFDSLGVELEVETGLSWSDVLDGTKNK